MTALIVIHQNRKWLIALNRPIISDDQTKPECFYLFVKLLETQLVTI